MLWLASGFAAEQSCEVHYPFEGSLADARGGRHGWMITTEGVRGMPQFVEGRDGQALALPGARVMRAFRDLNPDACTQSTISDWPRYQRESDELLYLGPEFGSRAAFREPQLDFHQARWEQVERMQAR